MSSHCPTSARPHRPFQPRGKGTADKAGSAQGKGLRLGAPAEQLLHGSALAPHSPRRPQVSRRTHPRAAHNGARRLAAKCVSARARTTTPRHPHGAPRPASPGAAILTGPFGVADEAAEGRTSILPGDPWLSSGAGRGLGWGKAGRGALTPAWAAPPRQSRAPPLRRPRVGWGGSWGKRRGEEGMPEVLEWVRVGGWGGGGTDDYLGVGWEDGANCLTPG